MKIMFTFLTFGKNIFGGIEHSLYNFILGLYKQGIDVSIYTSKTYSNTDVLDGINVYTSDYLQTTFTGKDKDIFINYRKNTDLIRKEFRTLYKEKKPDLIVCVDHLWGILPILNMDIPCKKFLWLHVFHNKNLLKKVLKTDFDLFAVSQFLANEMKTLTNKKINILPNSVIYSDFQLKNIPKNIIFCNARLSPEKRVIDAVKAFSLASQDNMELHLCSGSFPFGKIDKSLSEIKSFLESNPKVKVIFHKYFSWEELPKFIASCNLIILPTEAESFGLSALEAMAGGIPLITTDAGNLPYLIKESGIIVPVGDINRLKDAILKVLQFGTNTALGKKIAKQYDYLTVSKQFLKLLDLGGGI